MKRKALFLTLSFLLLFALAACLSFMRETAPVSPGPAVLPAETSAPSTATRTLAAARPTPTPAATATVVPASGPILPAPPLSPDVPVMGNAGQPGADGCTVAHPGPGDTGPLYVYKTPAEQASAIVAQLGLNRWAVVIGRDNDWYRIQDADGVAGWVPVAQVAHNGLCQADEGPGSLPLVQDPGAPPSNTCVASRPGQFPPPDIHAGPGRHFGLMARLGNWAEVLQSEMGWHQILLGPTQVGWVDGEDVDLTGPCLDAQPAPERPPHKGRGATLSAWTRVAGSYFVKKPLAQQDNVWRFPT